MVDSSGHAVDVPQAEMDTLSSAISFLLPACKWACRHLVLTNEGAKVAQAICKGSATAVSDGSLKDGIPTAAFAIDNHVCAYKQPIVGALLVPGIVKEGDSL